LVGIDFLEKLFQIGKLDLGFPRKIEDASTHGLVHGDTSDGDVVGVAVAVQLEFVSDLDSTLGAVVVVEDFLGKAAGQAGFF